MASLVKEKRFLLGFQRLLRLCSLHRNLKKKKTKLHETRLQAQRASMRTAPENHATSIQMY